MKYQWLQDEFLQQPKSCHELGQKLGCTIKSITNGSIIVGYQDGVDAEGNPAQIPILKKGIELDLEGETAEILEKLDIAMLGFKREGGKSIAEEVTELKAKVALLAQK